MTKIGKFKIRVLAAYRILFRKYNHWAVIDLDDKNLIQLLKDQDFETNLIYHGIRPYIFWKMIKQLAISKDEVDMMLHKAEFEAEASIYNK